MFEEIDHHRDAKRYPFVGDEIEELHNLPLPYSSSLNVGERVHVTSMIAGRVRDLIARHLQRRGVIAGR